MTETDALVEVHCEGCGRLLYRATPGSFVEIVCRNCRAKVAVLV